MPTLTTAMATTTTQTVTLAPTLRRKLLTALRLYGGLKDQEKVLELAKQKTRMAIQEVLEEVGESTLTLEGYTATIVAPVKKVLDRKRFVQLGGDLALLDQAYVEQEVTPYIKISAPKEEAEE